MNVSLYRLVSAIVFGAMALLFSLAFMWFAKSLPLDW